MNFSLSNIIAGIVFSIVGFWLFKEGRRRLNIPVTVFAILLMSFSLFTQTSVLTWIVGLGLCGGAYYFWE